MKQRRWSFISCWAAILFLSFAPASIAQGVQDQAVTLSAVAGFDGFYKGEFWLPVNVTASNVGPSIDGYLQVNTGSSASRNEVVYRSPISLPSQSKKRQTLPIYLPNLANEITVELVDSDGRPIASAQTNSLHKVDIDDLLYGVASTDPGELVLLEGVHPGRNDASVAFLDVSDLPESTPVWNALDILVIQDVDTGQLTPAQLSALNAWLDTGGQLVVLGGPNWKKTTAGLEDLLPVMVSRNQSFEDLPALREYTGLSFRDPGPYLATTSSLRQGDLLIHESGFPLLARRSQGRGSVYFLALDPELAPLADWDGSEIIWNEIAGRAPRLPAWGFGAQNSYSAASAVSSLPSLSLPSAVQLFFFLVVYVMVIGPLNYLVLKRLKRRELAWLTVPGLVLVFTIIAYLTGFRLKGNDPILNQMSIAFGSTDGDRIRVQSLIGMYSPRRATYELNMQPSTTIRPFDQSFGSLSGGANIGAVEIGNIVTIKDVRIDVSQIETFVADGYQETPPIMGQAELTLDGENAGLSITVQNNGNSELQNATILLGSAAIPLGDLEPGAVASVSEKLTSDQPAVVTGGSPGTIYVPPGPGNSPLAINYGTLLGTINYYNDPKAYPRWQLLEAITPPYDSSGGWYPRGTATLVAWSDEPQIDMATNEVKFERPATTLYFLEIPYSQTLVKGQNLTVPKRLIDWQVLAESGVYNARTEDLYMPPGWVEFEFQPWSEFQDMAVTGLSVALTKRDSGSSQPFPRLQLWDWTEEVWVAQSQADWGLSKVEDYEAFLGPGNAVRIRLQNSSPQGIEILEIYPEFTGDFQ